MIVREYKGTPDDVAARINMLAVGGMVVSFVELAFGTYIIGDGSTSSPSALSEDGGYLLLEDGFKILLE